MSLEHVLNAGTRLHDTSNEKRNIRLTNSVAIGLAFIVIFLVIVRTLMLGRNTVITLTLISNAIIVLAPLLLNRYGFTTASRIALCWTFQILLLADIRMLLENEVPETSSYLGFRIFQVSFAALPFLVFDLSDWRKIIVGFSVPFLLIVLFDPILSWLNVGYEQVGLHETTYYYNSFRTVVGVLVISWSLFSLKRVIERQQLQNAMLTAELNKTQEQELELSREKLKERLKELKTLYDVSRLVSDKWKDKDTVLREISSVLPQGWQFPELCSAKIVLYNKEYTRDGFKESKYFYSCNIILNNQKTGSLTIYYADMPDDDRTLRFLDEEISLQHSIAQLIQIYIEEQEKAEALKRAQANLISTINNTDSIIWSIDREKRVIACNTKSKKIMWDQLNIEVKLGHRVILPGEHESTWNAFYDQALAGKHVSFERVSFGRNYQYSLNPIIENDQIIGVTIFGNDVHEITEYRTSLEEKVKERTVELNKALEKEKELATHKTRFASAVSHEFRTPLATIRLTINQIKRYRSKLTPESIDEKVDIVLEQVDHMTYLLENVLSLGKTEDPKLRIKRTAVNLIEFFDTIKNQIESVNQKTGHKINCNLLFADVHWETDPDLIRNIFSNLLSNAIKFSPDSKLVIVSGSEKNGTLFFEVTDHGIGIEEKDLARIFLPFDRGSNVEGIPGTGLGLSIVKKAVELLQGGISVESTVGNGTTFNISFPRRT